MDRLLTTAQPTRSRRFLARIMPLALLLSAGGIAYVGGVGVASATTCPSGSGGWYTGTDSGGNQITESADGYGSGADTCVSPGTDGALTVTQANPASAPSPTSYPNDGYGCGQSYCTSGWKSELWLSSSMTVSGSINNSRVASGSKYDLMVDSFFTSSTRYYNSPNLEIEIVLDATPSYAGLGECISTWCRAKEVTIAGAQWWMSERTAKEGWPDYFFVRNTMTTSFSSLPLHTFYEDASTSGLGPGLGTYNLGYVGSGTEFWANGLGMQFGSASSTNVP
jgi:hypothetical protein